MDDEMNKSSSSNMEAWKLLDKKSGTQKVNPYIKDARNDIDDLIIRQPINIVDFGCSSGAVGERLKRKFNDIFVWGVEIGEASEDAKTKLDKVTTYGFENFTMDDKILLSKMDTILLLDVLEHMYDPWHFLIELADTISDDAQIIISLPNIAHFNVIRDLSNNVWHYKESGIMDITHIRFFTHYEMLKMIYDSGFKVVKRKLKFSSDMNREILMKIKFPIWLEFDEVKIKVKNLEHYLNLNSRQIIFNVEKISNKKLTESDRKMINQPHLPSFTF